MVGYYRIGAAVQRIAARYADNIRSRTANVCSHGIEKICHVNNMGFACSVVYHGFALCTTCGKHNVYRCTDACHIKINLRTAKLVGRGGNYAEAILHICSESAHSVDMIIHGTLPYRTPARLSNFGTAAFSEQRTEHVIRRTQLGRHFVCYAVGLYCSRIDNNNARSGARNRCTH